MPRKGQSSQQRTQGTPSSSRKRQHNQTLTQPTLEQSFSRSQKVIENFDELVNNCVRYVIYRTGNKLPIRKTDVQKHVLHNAGRSFDRILTEVTKVLKNVYGYDLYLSDEATATKQYLVSNTLPYKSGFEQTQTINNDDDGDDDDNPNDLPEDVNKILIMLVLSHIFMSNNNVTEASLFTFLRSIQIDPDERHEVFGNVKDLITSTMVKQKYLSAEVDQFSRRVSYLWGPRAEHEISKHALLKFVCKMYKDRTPKSWTGQFESANAQAKDGESIPNGVEEIEEEESS